MNMVLYVVTAITVISAVILICVAILDAREWIGKRK